jgi:formate-nitrite transporter family protein
MPVAPDPTEIYARAIREGDRRLGMSLLEEVSTGFIAGVTIVFGIVALGLAEYLTGPVLGTEAASLVGALAFAVGLVFLVVGRSELFTENFFDPVAVAIERRRRSTWLLLLRLWVVILLLNLVGGAVFTAVFTIEGALPDGAREALVRVAEDIATKDGLATFVRGVAAGTLLTLLSYLLNAAESVGSRMVLAYMAGFFLALGAFDHVVVSALQLLFGVWLGGGVDYGDVAANVAWTVPGNLIGGILLMTLTHTAQVKGAGSSS